MNRRSTLVMTIMVLLCVVLTLPADDALAQQKTLKQQLQGAWTLVSIDTIAADGTKRQRYGSNPKGVLILDPSGRYANVAARPDRPKFKAIESAHSGARSEATAEEFAAAARGFIANFGTWSINEADKTLILKYEIALIPNNEGSETTASVSLVGDELKLTIIRTAGGRNETLYRRAK